MFSIVAFPFRVVVFVIAVFFYWMEIGADWFVGFSSKTEYIRKGACKRCGKCCRLLALEGPRFLMNSKSFLGFIVWYHRFCFNFRHEGSEKNWLIYRCGYLSNGERAHCLIHSFRHRLCRFYPRQRLYGHPKVHRDCGFRFVRRDGKPTFDEILEEKLRTSCHP